MGVDSGQGCDVDGEDLGVVLVDVQVEGWPDTTGLAGGQAEVFGEAVAGPVEQRSAFLWSIGQRQQRMEFGGSVEGVADPGVQALPPNSGWPGQQQDADRKTGAVQERFLQEFAKVWRGPAFGVVDHEQAAGPGFGCGGGGDGVGAGFVGGCLPDRPPRLTAQAGEVASQAGFALSAGTVHQPYGQCLGRIVAPAGQCVEVVVAASKGHHLMCRAQQPRGLFGQHTGRH